MSLAPSAQWMVVLLVSVVSSAVGLKENIDRFEKPNLLKPEPQDDYQMRQKHGQERLPGIGNRGAVKVRINNENLSKVNIFIVLERVDKKVAKFVGNGADVGIGVRNKRVSSSRSGGRRVMTRNLARSQRGGGLGRGPGGGGRGPGGGYGEGYDGGYGVGYGGGYGPRPGGQPPWGSPPGGPPPWGSPWGWGPPPWAWWGRPPWVSGSPWSWQYNQTVPNQLPSVPQNPSQPSAPSNQATSTGVYTTISPTGIVPPGVTIPSSSGPNLANDYLIPPGMTTRPPNIISGMTTIPPGVTTSPQNLPVPTTPVPGQGATPPNLQFTTSPSFVRPVSTVGPATVPEQGGFKVPGGQNIQGTTRSPVKHGPIEPDTSDEANEQVGNNPTDPTPAIGQEAENSQSSIELSPPIEPDSQHEQSSIEQRPTVGPEQKTDYAQIQPVELDGQNDQAPIDPGPTIGTDGNNRNSQHPIGPEVSVSEGSDQHPGNTGQINEPIGESKQDQTDPNNTTPRNTGKGKYGPLDADQTNENDSNDGQQNHGENGQIQPGSPDHRPDGQNEQGDLVPTQGNSGQQPEKGADEKEVPETIPYGQNEQGHEVPPQSDQAMQDGSSGDLIDARPTLLGPNDQQSETSEMRPDGHNDQGLQSDQISQNDRPPEEDQTVPGEQTEPPS